MVARKVRYAKAKKVRRKLLKSELWLHSRFSKANLIVFALVFAAIGGYAIYRSFAATSPNIYIAQSPAGTANGTSCANAEPAAFFNTATNWGSGNQIAPGTTVHLCGTIISPLAAQGSGDPSSPITILFEPNAKLSEPVCDGYDQTGGLGGCLRFNGRSYITVDGGSNGIIESTDNGTTLGHQQDALGIQAYGCNNCEVKNLTIRNMYVHTSVNDEDGSSYDHTAIKCIEIDNTNNFSFHNNICHDAGWAIYGNFGDGTGDHVKIYNNDIYNVDHGWVPAFYKSSGGHHGPFYFYGNHVHDYANWDDNLNHDHHDGIHCYTTGTTVPAHIDGMYIYDNRFDGDVGTHTTAHIYIEGNPGSTCADATSDIWIFNNYFKSNQPINNGLMGIFSGRPHVFNNTIIGSDQSLNTGVCYDTNSPAAGEDFRGNVMSTCRDLHVAKQSPYTNGGPDYNVYANGGINSFVCTSAGTTHYYDFSLFNSWQNCIGGDSHSVAVASAGLGANGVPQAGSAVIAADTNLTSLCSGDLVPLCSDINGQPRPSSGPWDAGAVQVTPVAEVWVSPSGNDSTCARGDQTKPCASFNQAYKLAQPGDKVLVAAGNYPKQAIYADAAKNIPPGTCAINPGGQNMTSCISFEPPAGTRPVIKGISILASGVRLLNLDVENAGVGVSWKDNPTGVSCKISPQPHDDIFDGIHNYVSGGAPLPGKAPDANIGVAGAYNVAVVNSDFGPFYDSVGTAEFSNLTQASSSYCAVYPVEQLKDKNIYVFNNHWHDLYQTVGSNGPNCLNDPAQYECNHMECIHWRASNSWIIDNRFTNCAQYDISVQTFGVNVPNIDNLQIIGNVFDKPCSNQAAPCGSVSALRLICSGGTDTVTNAVIAYNSIWGDPSFESNCASPTPFAGSVAVGNLNRYASSAYGCNVEIKTGVAFRYNVWDSSSTATCDPTDLINSGNFPWLNPNAPTYNFALTSGSVAANFVPRIVSVSGKTISCPATDIAGVGRPQTGNSLCAAGAYEPSTPSSNQPLPGDLNSDGRVNIADLSIMLANWGSTTNTACDLNHNGVVDIADLSILLANYSH